MNEFNSNCVTAPEPQEQEQESFAEENIVKLFQEIDIDGDGSLSFDEIKQFFTELLEGSDLDVTEDFLTR